MPFLLMILLRFLARLPDLATDGVPFWPRPLISLAL